MRSLLGIWMTLFAIGAQANTVVKLGQVTQIKGPQDVDLTGEFVYAINFSANDPVRTVNGVSFLPDRLAIPGAVLVGPQQVAPWQTKPEFGATADANALEEILQDIRWANSGGGERLRATLKVTPGDEYKLQILISGNGNESRRWDIRVNNQDAVDEITSLGSAPGQSYAANRATLYSYQFVAPSASVVVEMGDLFGNNDGGDRNPIWQALTLERVSVPPTPADIVMAPLQFFPSQVAPIAAIQVIDQRFAATHTLSLVAGEGDTDNAKFSLADGLLRPTPFDFSGEPPGKTYTIRLRAEDSQDAKRFLEKTFTLTLETPHAPSGVQLAANSVSRAATIGSLITPITGVDPDAFDRHTFELVDGAGSEENAFFRVEGNELRLAKSIPDAATRMRFRLKAIDIAGLSATQSFDLPIVLPKVRINEILASEVSGVVDENNQAQEWLELFNELDQPLDLTGWYLTDDRDKPTQWQFPATIVPARGFVVVLADGTGAVVPGSSLLHANFSLSAGGEWLGLVRPDGRTIASELQFPVQFPGVAYGYGANGDLGHLPTPTPGATNGTVAPSGENRVIYSRPHGFVREPFSLELSSTLTNAVIRYTLDGTRPSATTGVVYSAPIRIEPATAGVTRGVRIVRAIAVHPDAAYSPVATQTYLFIDGVAGPTIDGVVGQSRLVSSITKHATYGPLLPDAFRALPVVSIVMNRSLTPAETRASLELFDPADAEPGFQLDCGIGATGTTSLGSPKLSMSAKFRPEYGASKLRYPIFARGSMAPGKAANEFKELRIRSHSHDTFFWLGTAENPPVPYGSPSVTRSGDAQLARNPWIDEMQILMGQPGKRGRQVHLFLEGAYHGIYHIHEHPDEDFMASYYPGKPEEYHFVGGGTTGSDHGGGDSWTTAWASMKASLSSYSEAKRWVDVTNLCDYMLLSFYAGNDWDWSAQHNWGAAGPKFPDRGGWKFFQQDSDITLQDINADCTDQDVPDGIFTQLMNYPDFRVLFRDRVALHCYNDGVLTPTRAAALYDARMNEIYTAIVAETARWQPSSTVGRLPWDRDQEWTNEWRYLRTTYFPQRTSRLITQLKGHPNWWPSDPPIPSLPGGVVPLGYEVVFSNKTGKVYYTIDGTDPRLPGGAISPSARSASGGDVGLVTNLIPQGAVWKFLDDGSQPAASWIDAGFNDAAWRSGPAQVGYGDGDEATVANFVDSDPATDGVQKNITTYFRRVFDAPSAKSIQHLRLRVVRDDGVVVYLNGREVLRDNMPAGVIANDTRATAGVGGADESAWFEFEIDPTAFPLLATGNVLAVEVHQADPGSSDISFNLELNGIVSAPNGNSLVVTGPLLLRARVYTGTDWSGLMESFFVPEGTPKASADNLLVSEIHYHPMDVADSEFLELLNTERVAIDLSGVHFAAGIEFTIPLGTILGPGERLVLAKDLAAFDARYLDPNSPYHRSGIQRLGPWVGSLANGGETLRINDASSKPMLSVTYGTTGVWPGRADGRGSSLELITDAGAPKGTLERSAWLSNPLQWRSSSEFHGSPGIAGAGPDNRIVINEVLAAPLPGDTDGIEFLNQRDEAIDIAGWFVSDSSEDYRKYRFPVGSRLDPRGRWVLRSADFDNPANAAALVPFGLNDTGDSVFLVEATSHGDLIRFVDRVEFGPSLRGLPLGRFPDGSGPMAILSSVTLGAPNALPEAGYAAWSLTAFPEGTEPALTLAIADFDEDGVSNFAEYAFVTSPLQPEPSPFVILQDVSGGPPSVVYRVRTGASDLQYTLQISDDGVVWRADADAVEVLSQVPEPDGATRITARCKPLESVVTSARWLRIQAALAPNAPAP